MLRINLYGGPGVGKSTLAAQIYAELNRRNLDVELVREFVKEWAYEGKTLDAWDQVFAFANQLLAEHRLAKCGVKAVITDSPVLLQCVYTDLLSSTVGRNLIDLALQYEQQHVALNFLVMRTVPYTKQGRYQDEMELAALDARIKAKLDQWKVVYVTVTPNDRATIIQTVKEAFYSATAGEPT